MPERRDNVDILVRNGPAIDAIWPDIVGYLDTKQNGEVDAYHLFAKIRRRGAIVFVVYVDGDLEAACVGQLEITAKSRTFWIELMGGEVMNKWLPELIDGIETYARSVGAQSIGCRARPGLAKKLRNMKWQYGNTEMMLPVNGVPYGQEVEQARN